MAGPLPYRARATRMGTVIAESNTAVRVDIPDAAPLLWFPRIDVVSGALDGLDPGNWQAGEGDLTDHVAFDWERVELDLDRRPAR